MAMTDLQTDTALTGPLSAAEVQHYHERGYVVPQGFRIDPDRLDRMRADLDRLIADNPHLSPDAMFCPHIPAHGPQALKGADTWMDHAAIPEVLDAVAQLIGPDILLWGTTVFGKPAHSGKETPWHQDGQYWPIRPLATCSVWIAIDPATSENGCLRVIPGSHRDRRVRGHDRNDSDGLPPHRRAGYVLRFMPTSSVFDRQIGAEIVKLTGGQVDFVTRPLYLMRGEDISGRNDFSVGKQ